MCAVRNAQPCLADGTEYCVTVFLSALYIERHGADVNQAFMGAQ